VSRRGRCGGKAGKKKKGLGREVNSPVVKKTETKKEKRTTLEKKFGLYQGAGEGGEGRKDRSKKSLREHWVATGKNYGGAKRGRARKESMAGSITGRGGWGKEGKGGGGSAPKRTNKNKKRGKTQTDC